MAAQGNKFGQHPSTVLTRRETASILGVSKETVYLDERRAIRKLQEAIEREAAAAGCSVRQWLFCGESI
jgi:DNA-binding CsgD family transcriptional regulator